MKRIRQGNTINFRYSVYRSSGNLEEEEDLTDIEVTTSLQNRLYGTLVDIPFSIEGNVITGQIPGIPHLRTGVYNFCLSYQKDGTDFAVDTDAFQIVDSSSKTGGENTCPHVEAETVEVKGVVEFGVIGSGGIEQVQADWKESNEQSKAFIKNKPILATVATSGSYNDLKDKPSGLNVPTKTSDLVNDSNFVADANYVHTDNNYTTPEKEKLTGLKNYDDSAIKTSILANTTAINAEVTRAKEAETALSTSLGGKVDKVEGKGLSTNDYTTVEKNKLAGIAEGAEVNVNADWNATEGDAQILNKPQILTHSEEGSGEGIDLNSLLGYGMFSKTKDTGTTAEKNYPSTQAGLLIYGHSIKERTNQIYGTYQSNRWFARSAGSTGYLPWKEFAFLENLAKVATSGSYNDLTNKPTIPTVDVTKKYVDDQITAVNTALNTKVNSSLVGANSGIAQLDNTGKVPSSQLPSYVDDVLEFPTLADFPSTGESGKIYVTADTNITYRWTSTDYVEISKSLALGETSSTAYAGDKGKKNATDIATLSTRVTTAESDINTVEAAVLALDSKFTNYSTTTQNDLKYAPKATTYSKTEVDTLIGAKLDASSYTAQDVLNKIKTVDGTGSGLDADLLGGKQASEYALKTEVPSSVTVDAALSTTSQNPVQNKVITAAINTIKYDAIVHIPNNTGAYKIADITDGRNMNFLLNMVTPVNQVTCLISLTTSTTEVIKLTGSGSQLLQGLRLDRAADGILGQIGFFKNTPGELDMYVSCTILSSNPVNPGSVSAQIYPGTITFLETATVRVLPDGWASTSTLYFFDDGPASSKGITADRLGSITQKDILYKNNIEEFVPVSDYEPATKKYVDQNLGIPITDWSNIGISTLILSENRYYLLGNRATLTIRLDEPTKTNICAEYMFEFTATADSVPMDIQYSDGSAIKWINEPTITNGKTYQVSVVNSLAVIGGA